MSDRTPPDTLYGWFAASVAAHPAEPALVVDGATLSYAELHELVEAVARRIMAATGGRAPARVGLLATRSALTYAGYLAVQRLSATVVPLNPIFPAGRNAAIATAGRLDLALVEAAGVELPVPVLRLADHPAGESGPAAPLPAPSASRTDIAYILFTSGSTGSPKGVPVTHGNVSSYIEHVVARYGMGPGARLSQAFDLTFDPSVFDMFAAWGSGAALVVPTRGDLLAPMRFVAREAVTHWFSVPSVISFAQRLHGLTPGAMPGLRWALFAGEALTLSQAAAWRDAAPAATIENLYGPTELTVTCTAYRLPAEVAGWPSTSNGTVPIGQVHPGLEHVVVDGRGLRAAEGELCVRGSQRFPGYLDPADDAGRFLAETPAGFRVVGPGEPITEAHWYRTGDRVRREHGEIVHLGRLDHQLKIRGYRVELGEIESAVRNQPGVRDAVVLPVPGADGELDLVAVYTGIAQHEDGVLADLRAGLPPYMIPRRIVHLAEMPLNVNGKIDRSALAALTAAPVAA